MMDRVDVIQYGGEQVRDECALGEATATQQPAPALPMARRGMPGACFSQHSW